MEIRTYDGDMEDLATFCNEKWLQRYQGQMPIAQWTAEFLEWELLPDGPDARDYLVAAYEGTELVGFFGARPMRFQLRGKQFDGTWGSFFTVDPDCRDGSVALKLNLEQRRRHRQRQAAANMGFVYFSYSAGKAKDFWMKQPKSVKQC